MFQASTVHECRPYLTSLDRNRDRCLLHLADTGGRAINVFAVTYTERRPRMVVGLVGPNDWKGGALDVMCELRVNPRLHTTVGIHIQGFVGGLGSVCQTQPVSGGG